MTINPIDRFITNLHAAFSRHQRSETTNLYAEKLSRWPLTEEQWAKALSRIIGELTKFPTLSEIYPFLRSQMRGRLEETEPVFRTWRDREGRMWAQPLRDQFRSTTPSAQDIEQWKLEQCKPDEAREAFRRGYVAGGGRLEVVAAMQRIITDAQDTRTGGLRHLSDYDDSPDALSAKGGNQKCKAQPQALNNRPT